MDRSCLRQQIERGQTPRPHSDRDRRVNIRSLLPPLPVYSSASEDLAKQLVTLSLDRTEPPSNVVPIDEFTSRDFFYDLDSYHRVHEQLLKDREYVKSWHTAICCNPHLFKDKVSTGYFFLSRSNFIVIRLIRFPFCRLCLMCDVAWAYCQCLLQLPVQNTFTPSTNQILYN